MAGSPQESSAAAAEGGRRFRRAARLLLIDESAGEPRVLMVRETDVRGSGATYWYTPGGGLEEGETFLQAAVRELAEETGHVIAAEDLVGPVIRQVSLVSFAGRETEQHEEFFLARIGDVVGSVERSLTEDEVETMEDLVWRTAAELAAEPLPVWPTVLREPWGFLEHAGEPIELGVELRSARIHRRGARVLLMDESGAEPRMLMVRGHDPHSPERAFWFTPGGGLEPEETMREAAVRELAEETGYVLETHELVGPVWRRTALFDFASRPYTQHEEVFVGRLADADRRARTAEEWTEIEAETIDEVAWMTETQLRESPIEVFPVELRGPWAPILDWSGDTVDLGEVGE